MEKFLFQIDQAIRIRTGKKVLMLFKPQIILNFILFKLKGDQFK